MAEQRGAALEFDPYVPGFDEDPYPVFARFREEAPVFYWEQGRAWLVFRHEDVVSLLRDGRFTTDRAAWEFAASDPLLSLNSRFERLSKHSLFSLSRHDHVRMRKLIGPAFTSREIDRLAPEIQRIVDETLAAAGGRDPLDVARDYAEAIPIRGIASMFKIPRRHDASFLRFTDAIHRLSMAGQLSPEEIGKLEAALDVGIEVVSDTVEERRRRPLDNDVLTLLIQAEEQGDRLSKDELVALVAAVLVGGTETTVHLICFAMHNLLRSPEALAAVRREPTLVKNVVEETLRYDNFGKLGIPRYALEDVDLRGARIRKGQMVMAMLSSALRDEAAYPRASMFDLRRGADAGVAFGGGAHYCIGATLARLEGRIAIETLVSRFPEMELVGPAVFAPHPSIRKMTSLPVRLRPARA
ncbi:cytochrome P450 [Sorangium sp. So ce834]|uniref:cytochrome P450 n=1 Tax=Sorangium sp. So ce834 TaxID=3133321 RepID=UPI003F646002